MVPFVAAIEPWGDLERSIVASLQARKWPISEWNRLDDDLDVTFSAGDYAGRIRCRNPRESLGGQGPRETEPTALRVDLGEPGPDPVLWGLWSDQWAFAPVPTLSGISAVACLQASMDTRGVSVVATATPEEAVPFGRMAVKRTLVIADDIAPWHEIRKRLDALRLHDATPSVPVPAPPEVARAQRRHAALRRLVVSAGGLVGTGGLIMAVSAAAAGVWVPAIVAAGATAVGIGASFSARLMDRPLRSPLEPGPVAEALDASGLFDRVAPRAEPGQAFLHVVAADPEPQHAVAVLDNTHALEAASSSHDLEVEAHRVDVSWPEGTRTACRVIPDRWHVLAFTGPEKTLDQVPAWHRSHHFPVRVTWLMTCGEVDRGSLNERLRDLASALTGVEGSPYR